MKDHSLGHESGARYASCERRILPSAGPAAMKLLDFAALVTLAPLRGASFLFIRIAVPSLGHFAVGPRHDDNQRPQRVQHFHRSLL